MIHYKINWNTFRKMLLVFEVLKQIHLQRWVTMQVNEGYHKLLFDEQVQLKPSSY